MIVESAAGARFLVPHLSEPVGFHLLVHGRYEPDTEDFIVSHLSPGDVFVDVGANIGVFTACASRAVGPGGKVLALEPSPVVFTYLERNIGMNRLENVVAMRLALSEANHDCVPFYPAPAHHFGMGALAPQFQAEPCTVRTATLDDLVAEEPPGRIRVVKVDVEGHELSVFRGGQKLLATSPGPAILFEFCDWAEERFGSGHPGQAQEYLMRLGYRLWRLEGHGNRARPLEAPLTRGSAMLVAERESSM